MRRALRSSLITLLALYLTFLGGTFITTVLLGPRIVHQTILLILSGGWLVSLLIRRRPFPTTPLDWPILTGLALALVSTLLSDHPRTGLEHWFYLAAAALFFYLIVDLMRAYGPSVIIRPMLFVLAVMVLAGIGQLVQWYFGLPPMEQGWFQIGGWSDPIPPTLFRGGIGPIASTGVACLLAMWTPVGLSWRQTLADKESRLMLTLWLIGAVSTTILMMSRGGILSLIVSLSVFGTLYALASDRWQHRASVRFSDWRWRVGFAALLPIVLIGVGFSVVRLGAIRDRLTGAVSTEAGDSLRLDLWESALEIGAKHPVLGAGLYSFGREARLVRNPLLMQDEMIGPDNLPLLIWAEGGALGVAAAAWLVIALLRATYRRWKREERIDRIRTAGAFAGLAGYAAQNMANAFVVTPYMLSVTILMAYLVMPRALSDDRRLLSSRTLRTLPAVLLGALLLTLIPMNIAYRADRAAADASQQQAAGNWQAALASIDAAQRIDPSMDLFRVQRAQIVEALWWQGDASLDDALDAYELSFADEETNDIMHARYALLLREAGDPDGALAEMERALAIYPIDPRFYLWAGEFAEAAGDDEIAREHYRDGLAARPYWAISPYWEETPLRRDVRDDLLSQIGVEEVSADQLRLLPPKCWQMAADRDTADSRSYNLLRCEGEIVLRFEQNTDEAIALFSEALRQPEARHISLRAEAHILRGLAHFEANHRADAERDARTAILLGDRRGHYVLGLLAQQRGDTVAALDAYSKAGPRQEIRQSYTYAVYSRQLTYPLPPELAAPAASPYDLLALEAIIDLHRETGDEASLAEAVDRMERFDPWYVTGSVSR